MAGAAATTVVSQYRVFDLVLSNTNTSVRRWTYKWSFNDSSLAGEGSFDCVAAGAGKGVVQVYKENPHWFAYNGVTPVFLKSYYNK
eukprot:gene25100-12582_t